jgi:tetratricopeptide (TPR) repeat protein
MHKAMTIGQRIFSDAGLHRLVLFLLPLLIYANTLGHGFVLDDGIVITENRFVKQGISGIPDLLLHDSFYGFFKKEGKEKLVAGGRYRPMSLIVFAIAYELVGARAFFFHLLSILAYAALCYSLYLFVKQLLTPKLGGNAVTVAFFFALVFCSHPVHTECVANIKGMDETLALLFSALSGLVFLNYLDQRKVWQVFVSAILLLLGMLSKENAITYTLLIPMAAVLVYGKAVSATGRATLWLTVAAVIFLLMRAQTLGFNPFNKLSSELMNNPFLKYEQGQSVPMSVGEKAGIITYCLFEYLRLMLWPHPLTHDYYPKHIPMLGMFSVKSLVALGLYSGMLLMAMLRMRRWPVLSFATIAFFAPLFLVSNILFPVGTNMGERFLFMPSAGFLIGAVLLVWTAAGQRPGRTMWILGPVVAIFCFLTTMRNPAWANNKALFETDVRVSENSAKIHNAIAGVMLEEVPGMKDSARIRAITSKAKPRLERALAIHPGYLEAQLQMGNAFYYEGDYERAIERYQLLLERLPEDENGQRNMQFALRERGRQLGQSGKVSEAREYILRSLALNPADAEANMLMGVAEGSSGNSALAISYFRKAIGLEPKNSQAYFNLGIAMRNDGQQAKADSMFAAAKALDPEVFKRNGMPEQ